MRIVEPRQTSACHMRSSFGTNLLFISLNTNGYLIILAPEIVLSSKKRAIEIPTVRRGRSTLYVRTTASEQPVSVSRNRGTVPQQSLEGQGLQWLISPVASRVVSLPVLATRRITVAPSHFHIVLQTQNAHLEWSFPAIELSMSTNNKEHNAIVQIRKYLAIMFS